MGQGQKLVTDGKYVIARTGDVKFTVRRATKNYLGKSTSGDGRVRVYQGTGRILLNPAPYWRYRIFTERRHASAYPSQATS